MLHRNTTLVAACYPDAIGDYAQTPGPLAEARLRVTAWVHARLARHRARAQVRLLSQLDDALLYDIGVQRTDLAAALARG